jgi:ribosomal protein L11 methyltransferase
MPFILERLAPGAYFIASGIQANRQDEALLGFAMAGLKPIKLISEGEWIALLAVVEAR